MSGTSHALLRRKVEALQRASSPVKPSSKPQPDWYADLTAATKVIQPFSLSPSILRHRADLLLALKAAPHQPGNWRAYLAILNDDRKEFMRNHSQDAAKRISMLHALQTLYERATTIVPMTAANRHTPVYTQLWLDLAALRAEDDPDDANLIFKRLKTHRIGQSLPLFWNAWADLELKQKNHDRAARFRHEAAACASLSPFPTPRPTAEKTPGDASERRRARNLSRLRARENIRNRPAKRASELAIDTPTAPTTTRQAASREATLESMHSLGHAPRGVSNAVREHREPVHMSDEEKKRDLGQGRASCTAGIPPVQQDVNSSAIRGLPGGIRSPEVLRSQAKQEPRVPALLEDESFLDQMHFPGAEKRADKPSFVEKESPESIQSVHTASRYDAGEQRFDENAKSPHPDLPNISRSGFGDVEKDRSGHLSGILERDEQRDGEEIFHRDPAKTSENKNFGGMSSRSGFSSNRVGRSRGVGQLQAHDVHYKGLDNFSETGSRPPTGNLDRRMQSRRERASGTDVRATTNAGNSQSLNCSLDRGSYFSHSKGSGDGHLSPESPTVDASKNTTARQLNSNEQVPEENWSLWGMLSGPKPESVITVNRRQYVILSEAGRGGSSKVFKVLNQDMEVLAIKRVKVPASSHFRTTLGSYANEIALLKQLRGSPSIIQLLDAEVQYECGTIKMVMEYGDTDLAKILLRKKSRSIDDHFTRGHWLQMLKAVHTIHEAKIIHGDLKPANFLVVRGELKLIDFGIAKAITSDDTTKVFREAQVGTPNYMSPEALVNDYDHPDPRTWNEDGSDSETDLHSARYRVGRASDIWSLGCILYQMLCGRAPFAHIKNTLQKLNCIQDPKYEISYRHVTDPVALQVLHGCLQRDPQNRMSIPDLMEHPFVCLSHDRNVRRANGSMKSASISEEDLLAVTMDFLDIVKREAVPRCSLLSTVIDDSDLAHGSNIVKALIPCLLKRLGKLSSSATPAPTVTGKSNYQNQSWKGGATPTTSVVTPSGAHTVLRGAGMAQNIR